MPRLVEAEPFHVERIYRESHALWGAGLTARDYLDLWYEIRATEWGRRHARFHVWLDDDGEVLSSLKTYRPLLQWGGSCDRALVLGAIFTPRVCRRRGHAAAALVAALEAGRREGARAALLFSDIGTRYYEVFGFREIAAQEQWGPVPRRPNIPQGWSLRDIRTEDWPHVEAMHAASCRDRSFAVARDAGHWEFIRLRSHRFFERLGSAHVRQRWRLAVRGDEPRGYLATVEGRGEWNVREVGSIHGDVEGMAAVLRLGAADASRSGLRRFYAWLPGEILHHLPDWEIRSGTRRGALPMILSLTDPAPAHPDHAYIPYQDQF